MAKDICHAQLNCLLDRDSLNKRYITCLRPAFEYADIVWDNCTQYVINTIERIQIEAVRIVTGTTRRVSLNILSKETGWDSLLNRRYNHKMCLFHKMIVYLTPS